MTYAVPGYARIAVAQHFHRNRNDRRVYELEIDLSLARMTIHGLQREVVALRELVRELQDALPQIEVIEG